MKLKFLILGLLTLSIVACDSYDESQSVADMRAARTEYVKAETALKTAEVAYQNALTKSKEIANAHAEAVNANELERLRIALEAAQADLEYEKAQFEYFVAQQKQNILDLEDRVIGEAYNDYTSAYVDWSNETYMLLNKQNELADANIRLAGAKIDDENWVEYQIDQRNDDIARYKSLLEEYNESLATYKALQESNDWDAVIVELKEIRTEQANVRVEINNLNENRSLTSDKLDDAFDALQYWASDNYISFYSGFEYGEGLLEMAVDFNNHKAYLKTTADNYKTEMEAAKAALDAASATDAGYNVLQETYNNALNEYNKANAAHNAYDEAKLKAQLSTLNSTYVTTFNKRKDLNEEYAVLYGKLSALNNEIELLAGLAFTIETSVYYHGAESVAQKLSDFITNTEDNIKYAQLQIDEAEEDLTDYESGNYSKAETVRNYEQQIANIEFKIAQYTSQVETSKAWLDRCEAKYKALLEG